MHPRTHDLSAGTHNMERVITPLRAWRGALICVRACAVCSTARVPARHDQRAAHGQDRTRCERERCAAPHRWRDRVCGVHVSSCCVACMSRRVVSALLLLKSSSSRPRRACTACAQASGSCFPRHRSAASSPVRVPALARATGASVQPCTSVRCAQAHSLAGACVSAAASTLTAAQRCVDAWLARTLVHLCVYVAQSTMLPLAPSTPFNATAADAAAGAVVNTVTAANGATTTHFVNGTTSVTQPDGRYTATDILCTSRLVFVRSRGACVCDTSCLRIASHSVVATNKDGSVVAWTGPRVAPPNIAVRVSPVALFVWFGLPRCCIMDLLLLPVVSRVRMWLRFAVLSALVRSGRPA